MIYKPAVGEAVKVVRVRTRRQFVAKQKHSVYWLTVDRPIAVLTIQLITIALQQQTDDNSTSFNDETRDSTL